MSPLEVLVGKLNFSKILWTWVGRLDGWQPKNWFKCVSEMWLHPEIEYSSNYSVKRQVFNLIWWILKVRSYYAAIALQCRTAPYCTEIAMLLHCGVAWKLNLFQLEMRWCCGDLRQKVIDILTSQRTCGVVWTDLKAKVKLWKISTIFVWRVFFFKFESWEQM